MWPFKKKKTVTDAQKGLSKEYVEFLLEEQYARKLKTWYEKYCKFAEILRIKPPKKMEEKFKVDIVFSCMNVTPTGVLSASILTVLLTFLAGISLSFIFPEYNMILYILPFLTFYFVYSYPKYKAQVLRVQAGDEAIKIILYMVIYLKLNPSFENAVLFAAGHAKGPISEDMKKAVWDLQIGKYRTVEDALGAYMQKWVIWNEDFVRSISLLYGVLIEPTEEGRDQILYKSLSFLLDSTQKRMKTYVEEVSPPLTILHVMGLMLPALGLVMFPMISIFMGTQVNVAHLIVGYVIILPLINLFFLLRILMKRPGAFMVPDISRHPELTPENTFAFRFAKKKFIFPIIPLTVLIGLVIMVYGLIHFTDLYNSLSIAQDSPEMTAIILQQEQLQIKDPENPNNWIINYSGLLATYSMTFGFGIMIYLYFYLASFQRIKIRNDIKNIESEFQVGLFSLGNYLSEGYPIEICVQKSLDEYEKLGMTKRPVFSFFLRLLHNIKEIGLTFKKALFDRELGILKYYPSTLIEEIMKILSDASEKSAVLLGKISKTIATYLENLGDIEAKIRELLEETRSDIKMQATFIVPMICGIVASLGIFMLNVLRVLAEKLTEIEKSLGLGLLSGGTTMFGDVMGMLGVDISKTIPMTVLQATVGIYTVETVALLAMLLSGIESGFDKVARNYLIAQILFKAIIVYGVTSFMSLFLFHSMMGMIITSA